MDGWVGIGFFAVEDLRRRKLGKENPRVDFVLYLKGAGGRGGDV